MVNSRKYGKKPGFWPLARVPTYQLFLTTPFSALPRIAELSDDVNLAPEALAATQQWVVNVRSEQSSSELAALLGAIELGETGHIANTYIWEFPEDADPKEVASQLSSRVEVGFAYPLVPLQL